MEVSSRSILSLTILVYQSRLSRLRATLSTQSDCYKLRIIHPDKAAKMNFKHQLQYRLKIHNLTAAELSRRSGVSKQSISDWLAGVQPRSVPQIKKIADVFGISVDRLFFGKEAGVPPQPPPFRTENRAVLERLNSKQLIEGLRGWPGASYILGVDGFIKDMSQSLNDALGWSPQELTSRPVIEFVHFWDRMRTLSKMNRQLQLDRSSCDIDTRFLCKNGKIKWLRWNAFTLHAERVAYVISRDVSDHYPEDRDSKVVVSLGLLIQEAVLSCKNNAIFDGIEYVIPSIPTGVIVESRQAQLSSAILSVFHQAALSLIGKNRKIIELQVSETPDGVECLIRVVGGSYVPDIGLASLLLRNQSGFVAFERTDSDLLFRIGIPKFK